MRAAHRVGRLALGLAAGLTLTLSGALPASAASTARADASSAHATETWTIRDVQQRICVSPTYGHPGAYFLVPVNGTWSTTLTTGIRNLPPGSTSVGGTPIPPGSNYGNTVNGFVQISIAPLPAGVYTAEIWASDGTVTRTAPATIESREGC
ncbi:DUF5980 family protein [Sphaerisporangium melleum]|uniref:DUF5980 family protein n=1 Tax=Sphaerisporangium melleum TaxID=321316 RepID=UPI0016673B44|nr:DUF5980 family protein [Sphaerisporangium melleum]